MSRLARSPGVNGSKPHDPQRDALAKGLAKVDRMIAWGRASYPMASENLRHWRAGSGTTRTLKAEEFQGERFLVDHLINHHRPMFIAGATRRLNNGQFSPTRPTAMEWTDSVNAPYLTDLFFAMGGFTVRSVVNVQVALEEQRHRLRFVSWKTDLSDRYDWDPGKATLVPGIGKITDEEMLAMERAGYGKSYTIRSDQATITHSGVIADAWLPA